MSLNDIKLSPYLVTQLYSNQLSGDGNDDAKEVEKGIEKTEPDISNGRWVFLGNNQKKVLVALHYTDVVHLPDAQLQFLTRLLNGCHLSLNDVAIINQNNYQGIEATEILAHFGAANILLFGLTAQGFGFPFETPQYQLQKFTTYTVVHAPALERLEDDKAGKLKLWASLKTMFGIK